MQEIYDDADVRPLFTQLNGVPVLNVPLIDSLDPADREFAVEFISADQCTGDGATSADYILALHKGVRAVEGMAASPNKPALEGWRKFITFNTGCNVEILWNQFSVSDEARIFAEWTVKTINSNGWGPDGNVSALGRMHSNLMAVSSQAGGGVRMNPDSGQFEAPTGDEARAYDPAVGYAPSPRPSTPPSASTKKRGFFRR